ncbi:hypothetical protein EDB89DRAFT_2079838 [Lactarius sanguifluus]|nr:hypothetical protein EDB89DRAFT_2079838 [Lactarius sanguifluus]
MSQFTIRDFLDIEATVDNEEEEDFEDEEFDQIFNDDVEEVASDWSSRLASPAPTDFTQQTLEIRAGIARRSTRTSVRHDEDVPRHYLVPREYDPHLWSVCVKPGHESDLVMQIAQRTSLGDKPPVADIASVFARAGIPGLIFLEGNLIEVTRAVRDLVTVLTRIPPFLVPLEQRVALLSPCNPLSRSIKEGQWVLFAGMTHPRDAETIVALVPRIPEKTTRTAKQKKVARPEPRIWSSQQLEVSWGTSKVQRTSSEEYIFGREKFRSGLIVKQFSPASLANVDSAPDDLRPFLRATFIRSVPSFTPLIHRFAQDAIKPGQWVKVESGDHRGVIGKPLDVRDSVAYLSLIFAGDSPTLQIPLRALAPLYDRGHHIKNRWSESSGIVTSVDEDRKTLTYVERDSQNTMNAVEPYDPPLNFYQVTVGTWVEFNRQREADQPKRRGYVRVVQGTLAFVIDEHTLEEFEIETRELEVCSTQGPSLPKNDPVHPLMTQRVTITRGPLKAHRGTIKEVGATAITVELPALMAGASSPMQNLTWADLVLTPPEVETARANPPTRLRTPSPGPEYNPHRYLTPEPVAGSSYERTGGQGHWLLSRRVQDIVERKCIPLYIRGLGASSMDAHDGNPAKTVPTDQRTLSPQEGEIIVKMVKRARPKQISIHPRFLVPWKPLVGYEVLIIDGSWFGAVGVVKGRQGNSWTVSFTVDDDSREFVFEESDLAPLEPLKYDPSARFIDCGHFIMRCVHPFVSMDIFMDVARNLMFPESVDHTEKVRKKYMEFLKAALGASPALRVRMEEGDLGMDDVQRGIAKGLRASRANDIYKLKTNTMRLLSKPGEEINPRLSDDSKGDHGFNHNLLGRMLIPTQHIEEYDKDPLGMKVMNSVEEKYNVTADDVPSFLYEDPLNIDPDDIFFGLMKGYFLIRCLRTIFLGPRNAVQGLGPNHRPSRACIAELCGVVSVTVPIMVYVAVLARFTLSSQSTWTGKDGAFNYEDFADTLFQVLQENKEWADETIRWWNKELFGHESGRRIAGQRRENNPNGFLAKARAHAAKHATQMTENERTSPVDDDLCMYLVIMKIDLTLPPPHRSPSPTDRVTPLDPGAGCGDGEGATDKDDALTSIRQKRKRGNHDDLETNSGERATRAKTANQGKNKNKRRR